MKKASYILFLLCLFITCSDDKDSGKIDYTTITDSTYISMYLSETNNKIYVFYKFNPDNTLDIQERLNSMNGKLLRSEKGEYNYFHPILQLSIQTTNYEATVISSRREFSFDLPADTPLQPLHFFVYDDFFNEKDLNKDNGGGGCGFCD